MLTYVAPWQPHKGEDMCIESPQSNEAVILFLLPYSQLGEKNFAVKFDGASETSTPEVRAT